MDHSITARQLLPALGGRDNIKSVTHCMTRLRFVLKDESIVNDSEIKKIPGVLGVMRKGGQVQIIIGNTVQECYKAFLSVSGISGDSDNTDNSTAESKEKKKLTFSGVINGILDAVSGSMAPILPAIIGCGMVKLLCIVLDLLGVPDTNSTFRLLAILGDAAFYFLPVLLAYTASKKFGCSTVLSVTIVSLLLHPDLAAMFTGSVDFLGLPVTAASYSSSVIPALLITWVLSYVERFADRITPGWTKTVFKPMIVLLIMLPLGLIVLAPLGTIAGDGVQAALTWLYSKAGWLTLMIFSAAMPFIVMTGMHYAFVPGSISDIASKGYDPLLIPAMLASNLAQGAAALAVTIRTRDKDLKSVAAASSASALIAGITEPALYGVNLRLKRPLIAACIGAGLSGLYIGITRLGAFAFATPALISIIQFISPDDGMNFVNALIAAGISVIATFITTLALGWKEGSDETDEEIITSPVIGTAIALENVDDDTFSSGVLGSGFAVIPSEGKVYAPFDGQCTQLFDSLHAMGLKSDSGTELLIHVGLETVSLGGKPFTSHISEGRRFKKGDLLMEFDIDSIVKSGCDITTPIIVTNEDERGKVSVNGDSIVIGGEA